MKMKDTQSILPFKIELSPDSEKVTAHAGLPLIIECIRAIISKGYYRKLRDALGYQSWKTVRRHLDSLVMLVAVGGECLDDLARLRADAGLCKLVGFTPTSPTQAKEFLYRFHQASDGRLLTAADDEKLSVRGKAQIRAEGPGLRALEETVMEVVRKIQALHPQHTATLDVDATIVEALKKMALKAYEGTIGYQPQMAWWAEQGVWICDEFRDGNVGANYAVKEYLERAFGMLPGSVNRRRLRGDSALYNEDALTWADEQGIQFAVSAEMSESLQSACRTIPEDDWRPYRSLKDDPEERKQEQHEERQWAEVVDFVPEWKRNRKRNGEPFRYIAIRVRSRQRDLLTPDEYRWRHYAVVSNMDWNGERLLRWHREKQGTVEHAHGVMKTELAAGTLPCGRFGANAAWWRINVLCHNLLEFMKIEALPEHMRTMRPKALRFRLFNVAGLLVRRARQLVLRISQQHPISEIYVAARNSLAILARRMRASPFPNA
jgi:hypothetical protein